MNKEALQLLEDFSLFSDWQDKYSYIIDLGKSLPSFDESQKTNENKVDGCVSQVWLISTKEDETFYFIADSDALIVRGLLAIILKIFSGRTKKEITSINFEEIFNQLGFSNHLTPSRSNGVFSVVKKILSFSSHK
jgi:cysteine desulfuration protein SufE